MVKGKRGNCQRLKKKKSIVKGLDACHCRLSLWKMGCNVCFIIALTIWTWSNGDPLFSPLALVFFLFPSLQFSKANGKTVTSGVDGDVNRDGCKCATKGSNCVVDIHISTISHHSK